MAQGPGDLDSTFGSGGIVITDLSAFESAADVAIQPDGRIVTAGRRSGQFFSESLIVRYLADGTLDPSFGNGGAVFSNFGRLSADFGAVVLQRDDKIVGGGSIDGDFAIARYLPNGDLDQAFGNGGLSLTDFGGSEAISALIVQPDGQFVAAGLSNRSVLILAQFNPDGTLDASFAAGTGRIITDLTAPHALTLQPDGKIIVAGQKIENFGQAVLTRYLPDGTPDPTFGEGGVGDASLDRFVAVIVQTDGKIVAAGSSGTDVALVRYLPSGVLDASFGNGGIAPDGRASAVDLLLQPDGKLVVIRTEIRRSTVDLDPDAFAIFYYLARYNPDGAGDISFADGAGRVLISEWNSGTSHLDARPRALALQPDGKIVLAGDATPNLASGSDIKLWRYLTGPTHEETARLIVSANPDVLWPPNHQMRPVSIAVSTDVVSGAVVSGCFVSAVDSSEGSQIPGETEWVINSPLALTLRATRGASHVDRVYTITVTCGTQSQSHLTGTVAIHVPHDRSKAGSK